MSDGARGVQRAGAGCSSQRQGDPAQDVGGDATDSVFEKEPSAMLQKSGEGSVSLWRGSQPRLSQEPREPMARARGDHGRGSLATEKGFRIPSIQTSGAAGADG